MAKNQKNQGFAAIRDVVSSSRFRESRYVQLTSCKEEEQSKWFKNLFLIAILCVVLMVIVDALGIYIHI